MDSKYYIIYKITNSVNSKFYIGMHKTDDLDDDYMGSGKLLKHAFNKYGVENFTKEILYVFDNEKDMKSKEAELVTEELCQSNSSYNLCPGGHGGFGYINRTRDHKAHNQKIADNRDYTDKAYRFKISQSSKNAWKSGKMKNSKKTLQSWAAKAFLGKTHTEETKKIMSEKAKERLKDPTKNSQYGTMWITNGNENKKIKKIDEIPEGWYKGRVKN